MDKTTKNKIVEALVTTLEIPPSSYEKAQSRYKDLGEWFEREGITTRQHKPRIYSQGSFRLGTVIRPWKKDESYDLDVGCRLESGITKATHTQEQLKILVGVEIEAYRQARKIENKLEEKHRCWRLEYADELNFHMDVVPSIPEEMTKTASLKEAMMQRGLMEHLAANVASHSGNITDDRSPHYKTIHPDWRISNSEGYALWFESRIETASEQMRKVAVMAKEAKVEKLPTWKWKSPLQQAVQILKRHRDSMFANEPDSKPISIILTTLAAEAYRGEEDVTATLDRILKDMHCYVLPINPKVPNPVNPNEDFADKWYDPQSAHLKLEQNFYNWLTQARADFQHLEKLGTAEEILKFADKKFALQIPPKELDRVIPSMPPVAEERRTVHIITEKPASPWCR